MVRFVLVLSSTLLLIHTRFVYSTSIENETASNEGRSVKMLSDLKYAFNTYQECTTSDLATCLKLKLLKTVDRISRSDKELSLTEGVTFIKDNLVKHESNEVNVEEAVQQLPRSLGEKNEALDNLLFDKIMSFFKGHVLQVRQNIKLKVKKKKC